MRKKTIEDYVELVYKIQQEKQLVHTNDVALTLHIKPASVTEIFQKLGNEGYINYKKYSGVTLTKKGKKLALKTIKKHDALKNFFMILGIREATADADACRIEHIVNRITVGKLTKFVEFVNNERFCSRWLDHFKYFEKTGKYIECSPAHPEKCPIHGSQKQVKRKSSSSN